VVQALIPKDAAKLLIAFIAYLQPISRPRYLTSHILDEIGERIGDYPKIIDTLLRLAPYISNHPKYQVFTSVYEGTLDIVPPHYECAQYLVYIACVRGHTQVARMLIQAYLRWMKPVIMMELHGRPVIDYLSFYLAHPRGPINIPLIQSIVTDLEEPTAAEVRTYIESQYGITLQ